MRRPAALIALFALLSLAFPAAAAQPTKGTFKGTGKYTGSEVVNGDSVPSKETAKVTIKVSNGKVTKFSVIDPEEIGAAGIPRQTSEKFSPRVKIRKSGKFSRTSRPVGGCTNKLKGRFETKRKAVGTFARVGATSPTDCYDGFAKTKFTVRLK